MFRRLFAVALVVAAAGAGLLAQNGGATARLTVVTSGAFAAAQERLSPPFDRANHTTSTNIDAPSMGSSPDSIPARLRRSDPVDVVIMSSSGLDELIAAGRVVKGSRVDVARSAIGAAVRAGAPKPDISTVDALKNAMLHATSIAVSSSISGVYITSELITKLGIADQVGAKIRTIEKERVAAVVARGEAELGFQQISELLPVKGIELLGPIPAPVQRVTLLAAGVGVTAQSPEVARRFIQFLISPAARKVITDSGLEALGAR